jgi:hypothetical protein
VIDWPLETLPRGTGFFHGCSDGQETSPELLGQDIESHDVMFGPDEEQRHNFSMNDMGVETADMGQRSWFGKITDITGRSIAYSPLYRGPAIVRTIRFSTNQIAGEAASFAWGASPSQGLNQSQQPVASVPLPYGTFFDVSYLKVASPYMPGDDRLIPDSELNAFGFPGSPDPYMIDAIIPWDTFALWCLVESVSSIKLAWDINFQSAPQGVFQGDQLTSPNPYNSKTYLGGGNPFPR